MPGFLKYFPFDGFDEIFARLDMSSGLIELDLTFNQFFDQQESLLMKNDACNSNGGQGAVSDGIHGEIIRTLALSLGLELGGAFTR